jgi:hypothetical protein
MNAIASFSRDEHDTEDMSQERSYAGFDRPDMQSPGMRGEDRPSDPDDDSHNEGGTPSDAPLNGRNSLVAHIERHGRCTKAASDCLEKMTGLAREFNHRTVGVAHLIIAMTLVPGAARQFRLRHIDVEHAFRQAMLALIDMQRVAPGEAVAER